MTSIRAHGKSVQLSVCSSDTITASIIPSSDPPPLSWLPSFECHCQSSAVLQCNYLSNSDHHRTSIRHNYRTDFRQHVCKDRVGSEHSNKDGRNIRETESGEFTKGNVPHFSLINILKFLVLHKFLFERKHLQSFAHLGYYIIEYSIFLSLSILSS